MISFIIRSLPLPLFLPCLVLGQSLGEKEAKAAFDEGFYSRAFPFYKEKAEEGGRKAVRFRYGVTALHLPRERSKGMKVLEDLADRGMEKARFWAGVGHQLAGRNEEALQLFHRYRRSGDEKIPSNELERRIQISIRAQLSKKKEVHVRKKKLDLNKGGGMLYRSYMTMDGNTLFYQKKGRNREKRRVFVAERKEGGLAMKEKVSFSFPFPMRLAGISSNGNVMILSARQEEGGWKSDLFYSRREGGAWSEPKAFGPTINSDAHEAGAWMSSNERLMVFSSSRKGGVGGSDLYIVKRLPTGDWAKARNLSPAINTPHHEEAPCLLPDERTLYFISGGHRSIGGKDLFKSYFEAEEKRWVVPENPGFPVNTPDHEHAVALTPDEGKALVTRSFPQAPYRAAESLELLYQTAHVEVVEGKVLDKDSGVPLQAELRVVDPMEHKVQGVYRTRSDDGSFILALKPGKTYEVLVQGEGYVPVTREVSTASGEIEVKMKKK